jgi:hypothetical protein
MMAHRIQIGQVWRRDGTQDSYLVTKVYGEALTTFALLRKTGAEDEAPLRVRVENAGPLQTLAGFTYAQESDEF